MLISLSNIHRHSLAMETASKQAYGLPLCKLHSTVAMSTVASCGKTPSPTHYCPKLPFRSQVHAERQTRSRWASLWFPSHKREKYYSSGWTTECSYAGSMCVGMLVGAGVTGVGQARDIHILPDRASPGSSCQPRHQLRV